MKKHQSGEYIFQPSKPKITLLRIQTQSYSRIDDRNIPSFEKRNGSV